MTIAILDMYDNRPNEGMRCILQLIRQTEAQTGVALPTTVFDVRAGAVLPGLEFDIYISTGGPGVPLPVGEAWEKPFFALMDALFDHNEIGSRQTGSRQTGSRQTGSDKKHVFLICHSFQLVIDHWNLAEVSRRKSTSFGILPIHKTDDGCTESLFEGLPDPFFAVDSRDFQVTRPNMERIDALGAEILALEKIRPHVGLERAVMAMRFSPEIMGTQFHPEADPEGMLRYFEMPDKRQSVIDNYGEAKYDEMLASLRDPDKIELTESIVLPGFLRQAISHLSLVSSH